MLKKFFQNNSKLYENNNDSIKKYNKKIIPQTYLISIFILFLILTFSLFNESMKDTTLGYFMTFVALCFQLLIFNYTKLKNKPTISIHIFGLTWFAFVLYLSVIRFNTRPAGTALIFFVVAPMLFLDKNHRMNLVVFTYYIIHIVLSFILKDISIARIDLINTTASMLVGILVGRLFLITRLN